MFNHCILNSDQVIIDLFEMLMEIDYVCKYQNQNPTHVMIIAMRESMKRIKYQDLYNQLKRNMEPINESPQ